MSLRLLCVLAPALLLPFSVPPARVPLPAIGGGASCPPGSETFVQVFPDTFGPEIGDWVNEQLVVPKFMGPRGSTLIQVDVELCGQTFGDVQFQNLDDEPCTLTYDIQVDAQMIPNDPASPVKDFDFALNASGGPIMLDPGESGTDSFDSGNLCDPVQTFTEPAQIKFFVASPGDEQVIFDHAGATSSAHIGCGVLDFQSEIHSSLSVMVRYTYCLPNLPPTCDFSCDILVMCRGSITMIQLDGSGATDPEGQPITFFWSTNCPNATIDDPTSPTPILTIDTTGGPCDLECQVRLDVSDGFNTASCRGIVILQEPG